MLHLQRKLKDMTVEDLAFMLQYLDPEKPIYIASNPVASEFSEAKSLRIINGRYVLSPNEEACG
jgi:hypothetical protein